LNHDSPTHLALPRRALPLSQLMADITVTTLKNGLRLHRIAVPGTRAVTILAAFDAGARTERPEENGMAHFLEHLVFKGGEKYPTYRDVNEAAESIGAVLNAYTSHDLVAFHITARAQRGLEAADLLTDFVARPQIDAAELDRERGVVVQEIARAEDQPATLAEHLIDEAVFGDHPLGRPVLGPAEHLRDTFTRDGILAFRRRRWSPARGAAFVVGNLEGFGDNGALEELFDRFEPAPEPEPFDAAPPQEPRVLVRERDSNQSHLRMSYRPMIDVSDPKQRAALMVYGTLLGGSMGSRLFDEIREQRGLAYSVSAFPHAYADVPVLQLSAGLESGKCMEAYRRMRDIVSELRTDGPTESEVKRAQAYAAGARTLAFENTGAVARYAAQQTIVFGEDADPDVTIELLDQVTFDEVREVAAGIADELSVAVVGPHTLEELETA
jgi:predicted Zn-dependent peptidase